MQGCPARDYDIESKSVIPGTVSGVTRAGVAFEREPQDWDQEPTASREAAGAPHS
jgi:hypothetical protein